MKATAQQPGPGERRCPQCYKPRPIADFIGKDGKRDVNWCMGCRGRYGNWSNKTPAQRAAAAGTERRKRVRLAAPGDYRVVFVMVSGNRKTGRIPVSTTERGTCPPACLFYGAGCYADYHLLRVHWDAVPRRGMAWAEFCQQVERLPCSQLWRHNEAGDLPGAGDSIDSAALWALVRANKIAGARGFTFTHKPVLSGPHAGKNRELVALSNASGFTVNLSANNLSEADALADLRIGPVSVVLSSTAPDRGNRTPAGRHVIVCPAETAGLTCEQCRYCSHENRQAIVGFRAHGQAKANVDQIVQLRVSKRRTADDA